MKKSIYILFTLFLFSGQPSFALEYDDESAESALYWFEGLRQKKHDWAKGELALLNKYRAKIAGIENAVAEIKQSALTLKQQCQGERPVLAVCLSRVKSAYAAARASELHASLILTSPDFKKLYETSSPTIANVRVSVANALKQLRQRSSQAAAGLEELQDRLIEVSADQELADWLQRQRLVKQAQQTELICKIRPPLLQLEYVEFMKIKMTATNTSDPWLSLDLNQRAKTYLSRLNTVTRRCASGLPTQLVKTKDEISHLAKNDPWQTDIPKAFTKVCTKPKSPAAKEICAGRVINEYSLAAIHTVLSQGSEK